MRVTAHLAVVALMALGITVVGVGVANAETYSFSCRLPRLGTSADCGAPVVMQPNDIFHINLVSSGGKEVTFCGKADGKLVNCIKQMHPGQAETVLWQNSSPKPITMQAEAKAENFPPYVHVLAQGNYRVEH